MSNDATTAEPLYSTDINVLQRIIGKFLYYRRVTDSTTLVAFIFLYASQSQCSQATIDSLIWLLDNMAMHTDVMIWFHVLVTYTDVMVPFYVLGMTLTNHSYAYYLSEPKYHRRAERKFYLKRKNPN